MNKRVVRILESIKGDLNGAYLTSFESMKDLYIKDAHGKVYVLIEILKEEEE